MQQEWLFIFYFAFYYIYIGSYHGGDTDVPGLRRYRPDAVPVETRLLPASSRFITVFDSLPGYSRWVPVVLNILKQPGTWAGLTRFNTVHPGSPRLSTVPPRLWHGSSRFIPDHQTGVNRHLKPGQWERGFKIEIDEVICCRLHSLQKSSNSERVLRASKRSINRFKTHSTFPPSVWSWSVASIPTAEILSNKSSNYL